MNPKNPTRTPPEPPVRVTCETCHRAFILSAGVLRKKRKQGNTRLFCSRECARKAREQKISPLVCEHCGTTFTVSLAKIRFRKIRGYKHTFCSPTCKKVGSRGEKSPLWKPDRSSVVNPAEKELRKSAAMDEWRSSVFKRDAYACRECGAWSHKGQRVRLEAHHIRKFSSHPELRFTVSNGITLCRGCHKKTLGKEDELINHFEELISR